MVSDRALEAQAPPKQRQNDFHGEIGEVLRLGWMGYFEMARTALTALLEVRPTTAGRRSLCRALLALVCAALQNDDLARSLARQAIHDSARPERATPEDELRRLRLGRALAANVSMLVGDVVRGRRAGQARFVARDPDSQRLIRAGLTEPWQEAPAHLQRYARFIAAVHAEFAKRPQPGVLTPAEVQALKLVATGLNAVQVAAQLDRSTHTVRTHLRNAHVKLGAHGRMDALVRARGLGLLDDDVPPGTPGRGEVQPRSERIVSAARDDRSEGAAAGRRRPT